MWEISKRRLPKFKTEQFIAAMFALIASIAGSPRVNAGSVLSFPTTEFTILDGQSNFAVGRGRYSIKTVLGGASLKGTNQYDSGTSDVETATIQIDTNGNERLVEADHTFFKIDGSIMQRSYIDLKAGEGTCINNTLEPKIQETVSIPIPPDTWAGASVPGSWPRPCRTLPWCSASA